MAILQSDGVNHTSDLILRRNGTEGLRLTSSTVQVSSINNGPLAGFRNAIINGNFDIWQRGTSHSTNGYGSADRWINNLSGSSCTMSRQNFTLGQTDVPGEPTYFCRMAVTSVAGANNISTLLHRIEDVRTLAGQQITVSFWAKADAAKPIFIELSQGYGTGGSPSSQTFATGAKKNLTTSWQKITHTTTVPSVSGKTIGSDANSSFNLQIWFDAGSNFNSRTDSLGHQSGTFDIAQVQVEAGPVATPFESRPIGTELALCQRYYHETQFGITCGAIANGQVLAGMCYYPVAMRVNPTITFISGTQTAFPDGAANLFNQATNHNGFFKFANGSNINANFNVTNSFNAEL